MRRSGRLARDCSGQSVVELVGLLPIVVVVALAVVAVLSAGAASRAAAAAAEAGAVAALQDGDAGRAARAALEGWPRRLTRVRVEQTRVTVEVLPRLPVPSLARRLSATATAHTGAGFQVADSPARGGDGLIGQFER